MPRIAQIAITVSDIQTAVPFYRDVLGLPFLFGAGANLAFLDAGGVRVMLSTPDGAGEVGRNSVLYFAVDDVEAAHAAAVGRGARPEHEPQRTARLENIEIWISFLRDPDDNLIGLMEERPV